MTAIPEAIGPPCDFGDDHAPAIGSLMQFADYSQTKFCGSCAPAFLREVADAIGGSAGDDECPLCGDMIPAAEWPAHQLTHATPLDLSFVPAEDLAVLRNGSGIDPVDTVVMPSGAELPWDLFAQLRDAAAAMPAPAEPAPVKPDPMTDKVVRSTHGNRKQRTPAKPAAAESDGE